MLATTNSKTKEILEVLEPTQAMAIHPVDIRDDEAEYLKRLAELRLVRIAVEERGIPAEYEALASEYHEIGAFANYELLMKKAKALRGEA